MGRKSDRVDALATECDGTVRMSKLPPMWVWFDHMGKYDKTKIKDIDKNADIDDLKSIIIDKYGLTVSPALTSICVAMEKLQPEISVEMLIKRGCGSASNPFVLKMIDDSNHVSRGVRFDLKELFEELSGLPERCSCERGIISPEALNVTLRNRESTLNTLVSAIDVESGLSGVERADKRSHKIPVISTLSGFGKSRILLELKNICQERSMWQYLYVTYNQAYSESDTERKYGATYMLAWRLIYLYFSPKESLDSFLEKLESQQVVKSLTVESAFCKIAADVLIRTGCVSYDKKVVFVVAIDEYQLLSSCGSNEVGSRLADVIAALSSIMSRDSLSFIVIPVFAGLYLKPFYEAAKILSVKPLPMQLEPLSYDDAAAIIAEYSGEARIMETPIVQQLVWQLSAIPAYLLDLYDEFRHNANWEKSYKQVLADRMRKQTTWLNAGGNAGGVSILCKIIACAVTETSVPAEVCTDEYLDGCGICWFVDRDSARVNVPYSLLDILSKRMDRNVHRSSPVKDYQVAFQESLVELCHESEMYHTTGWEGIESLGAAYLALRINSYGLLMPVNCNLVPLKNILHGAALTGDTGDILVSLSPAMPIVIDSEISPTNLWAKKQFIGKAVQGQTCVDAVVFFPDCRYNDLDFDLFLFIQRKFRPDGGLVPVVYKAAAQWCRKYVAQYKEQNKDRRVGFVFGVVNPLESVSAQVLHEMEELCKPEMFEFYFAIGREECRTHYTIVKDHPSLVPQVYINSKTLTCDKLAVVLQWTCPDERAAAILSLRPENGFTSWEQIVAAARLERDGDNAIDPSLNPAVKIV